MNKKIYIVLLLFIALILGAQPSTATIESFSGPGYEGVLNHVEAGAWQSAPINVTSGDDFNVLALVYSEANDFDLYVYDPISGSIITQATEPYSSENGLNFLWAVSTLNPGRYTIGVHANRGSGYFAFLHFNRSTQTRTATPAPPTVTATPPPSVSSASIDSASDLITQGRVLVYDLRYGSEINGETENAAQYVVTSTITGVQGARYSVKQNAHCVYPADGADLNSQLALPAHKDGFVQALYAPPDNPTSVFQSPYRVTERGATYAGNPLSSREFTTNNAVVLLGSISDTGSSSRVVLDGQTGAVLSLSMETPAYSLEMYLREVR
jgi:hypothetical protein